MTANPNRRLELRQKSEYIMQAALKAVDPAQAVYTYFEDHPEILAEIRRTPGRLLVVGAGKAGAPMAQAVSRLFGDQISQGRVVVKVGHTLPDPLPNIQLSEAGHPVPDEAGVTATRHITELLAGAGADDTVLCLISGGGSALLVQPAGSLTLTDLQQTTQALLDAGSTITQVNTLRRHLSAVKGGQLARWAAPARGFTLILSDVVGDPLPAIASGPTVPDPTSFGDAWAVISQFQLEKVLPGAVLEYLQAGQRGEIADTPGPDDPVFNRVTNVIIGSNLIAAQAAVEAARQQGFTARLLSTYIEGEAREVGCVLAGLAKGVARGESGLTLPACLVLGGETTVTIRGDGKGGRNQEMALSAAIALTGWPGILIACLGTDGNDGPTDAAGAFADGTTVRRAVEAGLNPTEYLQRNDAYHFFKTTNDLIMTGPTNTNVNDLSLILVATP